VSLSKWSGVHPYVAERVRYLLQIADRYGSRYTVTSGKRTSAKQQELYRGRGPFPVAQPGCSQHEYGLAMDVSFRDPRWQNWYLEAARIVGLVTVPDDPVHVQAARGSAFRPVVEQMGLCPDPRFVQFRPQSLKEECFARSGVWSCGRFGCRCRDTRF